MPAESNDEVPSGRKAETIPLGGEDQFAGQVSHACRGATSLQPDEDTYVAISFHEESVLPKLHGGKAAELEQDLEADGYKRTSPVCRANLWCHEEYIDTCVDSGATLSLLSSKVYKRVEHTGCVTPIRPTKDILTGVSGKRLKMEGVTLLTFSFDGHICQAPVMVGELHGVDLLLGMDWLSHNDAHIDFSRMLLRFRKDVVVPLRTTRNVFSRAHSVRFHTRDDSTNGMQYVYSDCVDGFVRVRYDQEILAGHAQQLSCYVTGPCEKKTTALFTPKLNLGPGVEVVESLVEPVQAHHGAWTIQVAVLNRTGENLMVEQHVQLGRLQAVDQHPTSVGNVHKKNSGYAVWDIAHQTLRQSANYLFGDGDCVVQTDLVNAEFRLAASEEKERQLLLCKTAEVKGSGEPEGPSESRTGTSVNPTLVLDASIGDSASWKTTWSEGERRELHVDLLSRERDEAGKTLGALQCQCRLHQRSTSETELQDAICERVLALQDSDSTPPDRVRVDPSGPTVEPAFGVVKESDLKTSKTTPDPVTPNLRKDLEGLPAHLHCMMPPEGVLEPEQLEQVKQTLTDFQDIFVGPDGKVGYNAEVTHKIETEGEPFKSHPRMKSAREKDYIHQEVIKLLKEGKIEPSRSPWGAPVVLVRKKDGTLRFCIDFRRLNDCTKKDAYPLPRIDECLDCLSGSQWFCTLDLASGYWQVAMDPADKEKTAFVTHNGLYHWIVMPFGLCNAPATFCRLMETVLADIVWSRCLVYLDDIITFGKDFKTCLSNLTAVFIRLRSSNLKLKAKKCELFRTEVDYLGHQVSREGIRPSKKKVDTLHDWAMPQTLTEVKSFVGFCSYYRRFIPRFSDLSAPFVALTKKGATCNTDTPECREAFKELREALTDLPLLHYADPAQPYILDTDASYVAIGACLSQVREVDGELREVPIGFASKTLSDTRRAYCTTKKELYAIVYFMRYWRCYISMSEDVTIRTDHGSLKWLMEFGKNDMTPGGSMYVRWATEMEGYQPWKVDVRPGHLHKNADGMSRARHSYDVKTKNCGIDGCTVCEAVARENSKCRGEDSDESDDEDPPSEERRSKHPLPESHLYGQHQLRLIRQKAKWGASQCKEFGGYRKMTCGGKQQWRKVWKPIDPCRFHEHHWATRGEEERFRKRAECLARKKRRRVRDRKREERANNQVHLRRLQVENVQLRRQLAAMELRNLSRDATSSAEELNEGTSDEHLSTMDESSSTRRLQPGNSDLRHMFEVVSKKGTSKNALLESTKSYTEQVRESNHARDSGYSSGVTISEDDVAGCHGLASKSAACEDLETSLQLPLRQLPRREARDKAKQALRDLAPQGKKPRRNRRSMGKKGRPPDDTPLTDDVSSEETDTPCTQTAKGAIPKLPIQQEPKGVSILKTIGWKSTDWIEAQKKDAVISRLRVLVETSEIKPSKTQCRRESRAVSQIIQSSWHFLQYNEQGILCRKVQAKVYGTKKYVWQRLVPDVFREALFRKVHQEACMHMGYSKVYAMMVTRFY